jgi:hypothetical protein
VPGPALSQDFCCKSWALPPSAYPLHHWAPGGHLGGGISLEDYEPCAGLGVGLKRPGSATSFEGANPGSIFTSRREQRERRGTIGVGPGLQKSGGGVGHAWADKWGQRGSLHSWRPAARARQPRFKVQLRLSLVAQPRAPPLLSPPRQMGKRNGVEAHHHVRKPQLCPGWLWSQLTSYAPNLAGTMAYSPVTFQAAGLQPSNHLSPKLTFSLWSPLNRLTPACPL